MAFAAITGGNSAQSVTANQTQVATGPDQVYPIGTLMICCYAVDNNQTTDGDEGAVTGITDTPGNVWTKAKEFTNGQGTAQTGATVGLWYSVLTSALSNVAGHSVSAAFSNTTSRDASVIILKGFSFGAGNTIAIEGTSGTLANDGADPGSLNVTTANIECLRIRAIAAETNSSTALTVTSGWTALPSNQTGSGGAAANQAFRGEFHISTGTGDASDPTFTAVDIASVYVAFKEVVTAVRVPQSFNYQPFLAQ